VKEKELKRRRGVGGKAERSRSCGSMTALLLVFGRRGLCTVLNLVRERASKIKKNR